MTRQKLIKILNEGASEANMLELIHDYCIENNKSENLTNSFLQAISNNHLYMCNIVNNIILPYELTAKEVNYIKNKNSSIILYY